MTPWTPEALIAFEADIAAEFNAGNIRAPIHLDGGNEEPLIEVFKDVAADDWICCSWRSHYKALLKGVPPALLKAEILAGRSIAICVPEYRVISSAIVGGILPIALGIAWQIKRSGGTNRVHCFLGDMTTKTGIYGECSHYAFGHGLPIRFIQEDNGKSVCSITEETWGTGQAGAQYRYYTYSLPWPHAGAGKRVQF